MPAVRRTYGIFMAIFGVAMFGLAIAYGYANYKGDQCSQSLQARIDSMNAQIESAKRTIDQK